MCDAPVTRPIRYPFVFPRGRRHHVLRFVLSTLPSKFLVVVRRYPRLTYTPLTHPHTRHTTSTPHATSASSHHTHTPRVCRATTASCAVLRCGRGTYSRETGRGTHVPHTTTRRTPLCRTLGQTHDRRPRGDPRKRDWPRAPCTRASARPASEPLHVPRLGLLLALLLSAPEPT